MALVNFTGFESGNTEAHYSGGSPTVNTDAAHGGSYSLIVNPTTTNTEYSRFASIGATGVSAVASIATSYVSVYVYLVTLPTDDEEILAVADATPANKAAVRVTSTGALRIYDDTHTQLGDDSTALELETWYRLDLTVPTGASQTVTLAIYTATGSQHGATVSGTGSTAAGGNAAFVILGKQTDRHNYGLTVRYDDLWWDSAALRGEHKVVCSAPNANGSAMDWAPSTGNAYDCVANVPYSDTDLISYTGSATALFDFPSASTMGVSGTINAVQAYTRIAELVNPTSFVVRIAANGDLNTSATTTLSPSAYNPRRKQSEVDGAAAAWTTSALDDIEAGVISGDEGEHACSTVLLMVDYTEAATSVPVFVHHYMQQ